MLGKSREALGFKMNIEADRYFHRGVRHHEDVSFTGFFQNLLEEVQPRTHEHLADTDVFEMMPWLRFATQIDPQNIDAYLGAAFWAAQQDGYLPQALQILAEARAKNPSNYRIPLQKGTILLKNGDIDGARKDFEQGLTLWPRAPRATEEQKRLDRAALLAYRGFIYELDSQQDKALACYKEALRYNPAMSDLRPTIAAIERGERSLADAERQRRNLYSQETAHHHHSHDHDHHHDHEGNGENDLHSE
jgi:tetratricopeptide (TPR) repeat protein